MELGAGKGYLGGTLVGCCGVRRLVVTDVRSGFKLKVGFRAMFQAGNKSQSALVHGLVPGITLPRNVGEMYIAFVGGSRAGEACGGGTPLHVRVPV